MATLTINHTTHKSAPRQAKYTQKMLSKGLKRVQRWVYDLDNANIQQLLKSDLAHYHQTEEMAEWDKFAEEQMTDIKGWE